MNDLPRGRVPNMPDAEYRADPGISNSMLKTIAECYAKQKYIKKPVTMALLIGRAVHLATFQPDYDLTLEFVAAPDVKGYKGMGTKDKPNLTWGRLAAGNPSDKDKEKHPDIEKIAEKVRAGAALMLHGSLDEVRIIAEAVRSHPEVAEWVAEGEAEVSYFAETPDGIRIKCRVDWEIPSKRLDLKTAENAALVGEQNFKSAIWKFRYDQQRVFYAIVIREAGFSTAGFDFEFVVADKKLIPAMWKAGCRGEKLSEGVAHYPLGKEWLESGMQRVSEALESYRRSRRTGVEGYPRESVWIGEPIFEDF